MSREILIIKAKFELKSQANNIRFLAKIDKFIKLIGHIILNYYNYMLLEIGQLISIV